jgi:hypothetical protein
MNREEIQKLLGGYATGTLTPEEEQALFAAALDDQELFDALGREQALRDLLRDPAAKAELLAALDAPERGGFLAWLRRPVVAGLAVAGVAAISAVSVWQATRSKPAAQVMVAELKMPEPKETIAAPVPVAVPKVKQVTPSAAPSTPLRRKEDIRRTDEVATLRDASADEKRAQPMKDAVSAANAPVPAAAPTPPPPPPPALAQQRVANTADTVEVTANAAGAQPAQMQAAAEDSLSKTAEKLTGDARSLFYGNAFARAGNALGAGVAGGALTAPQASSTSLRVANGTVVKKESAAAPTSILGVRVSVLRGAEEAAVSTVLDPGESVRLRVMPNADGFLYVAVGEGKNWRMVASGPAERLKAFDTPTLPYTGSGPKQVYVMLSRVAQTLSPKSLPGLARTNMVETAAEQDRATYVVAKLQSAAPQQVVQAITLTYR